MTLTTIVSIAVVLLGVGGVIRGWQMGYGNRLDLISDWDHRPLPNPSSHSKAFSRVYLSIGSVLIGMPVLLLLGLHIFIWYAITAVIVWYWFYAIDAIVDKARTAR